MHGHRLQPTKVCLRQDKLTPLLAQDLLPLQITRMANGPPTCACRKSRGRCSSSAHGSGHNLKDETCVHVYIVALPALGLAGLPPHWFALVLNNPHRDQSKQPLLP